MLTAARRCSKVSAMVVSLAIGDDGNVKRSLVKTNAEGINKRLPQEVRVDADRSRDVRGP